MTRPGRRPWLCALALALVGVLLLSGCGKKGPPRRPEGATYPGFYPSPKTTFRESTAGEVPTPAELGEDTDDDDETYFYDRTTTKTYDSE